MRAREEAAMFVRTVAHDFAWCPEPLPLAFKCPTRQTGREHPRFRYPAFGAGVYCASSLSRRDAQSLPDLY